MNRYPQIVEHFARIARANFGNAVGIDDLCRLARANPRTISRAFKVVHGTTPSRYLRELRLIEVRRVLLSGRNRASITQVAMRFGFRELGRFSALYRKKFEEAPSVTKNLSESRHEPHDARQGAGRVDFVDVDRPSMVESSVSHATDNNTEHPRER
jgi:transcriptional regulator GlxA family with amidase domain